MSDICVQCKSLFQKKSLHQRFCSDLCRYRAKHMGKSASPEYRLRVRERSRLWSIQHRGVKRRNPWLYGPPVCEPYLPGGALELYNETPLRWPLEHRNIRGLHGGITDLMGEPHDPVKPKFTLAPWPRGIGWVLYFNSEKSLAELSGSRRTLRLYDQSIRVRFGGAIRVKSPTITKRGRRDIQLHTITPVCTRSSGRTYQKASGPNLLSTLCTWLPPRVQVSVGAKDAKLEVIQNDTHPVSVPLGGKYGVVAGWEGSLVLRVNAVTEWLLRTAGVVGLGGRCAFGFGHIKVV